VEFPERKIYFAQVVKS